MTTFGKLQIILCIALQGEIVSRTLATVENIDQSEAEQIVKQFKADNSDLCTNCHVSARFVPDTTWLNI